MSYQLPLKSQIRNALRAAFPNRGAMTLVVADAGMKDQWDNFHDHQPSLDNAIQELIDWAEANHRLYTLLEAAINRNETSTQLKNLAESVQKPLREVGVELGEFEQIISQKAGFEDVAGWIANLSRIRRAVCRVEPQPETTNTHGFGTGFLIAPDIVITAWH